MRAVIQRSKEASVTVDGEIIGTIDKGLVVLLGVQASDDHNAIKWMADKIINLRIFEDENNKMNLSLKDTGGEMLIVSQFTLYGDCRKGRRPGYSKAAPPALAEEIYEKFISEVQANNITVATGQFQAMMDVQLINDGPVTLMLDSDKLF